MIKWTYGKCHVCGFDGDRHGTSMHQCWSDRTLLEKIADAVGVLRGSEPPSPLREQHYREALESAAKAIDKQYETTVNEIRGVGGGFVDVLGVLRHCSDLVRSHKVTP